MDPYLLGDRNMFSVTSAILRKSVPRRHISVIILSQNITVSGKYDSEAAGETARTRNFAVTGSNIPRFSLHWNNEDSRPIETASRH